jgi:hypothetical protein
LRRLSLRARILLVVGLAALTGLLAAAPRPFSAPIAKVANYRPDPPGPIWNTPIDDASIRKAAAIMPRDAVYVLLDGPPAKTYAHEVLSHDLLGAAYIDLLPRVPAKKIDDAGWAIAYHQAAPKDGVQRRWTLGPGIELLKLRRA